MKKIIHARAIALQKDKTLLAIAALHIGFAVFFFAMVFLMTSHAHGKSLVSMGDDACVAEDIYASLTAKNPALENEIAEASSQVLNGQGTFWRLEREGYVASYLMGTMHLSDERVTNLPAAVQAQFDAADAVVIETTDVLDQSKQMSFMAQNPDLVQLDAGTTLLDYVDDADEPILLEKFKSNGIPLANIQGMRPWLYASLLMLPSCELQRMQSGTKALDMQLGLRAIEAGKEVLGLETLEEQIRAINSQSVEEQVEGLVQMVKLGDDASGIFESMLQFYLRGDIGGIMPMLAAVSKELLPDEEAADQSLFEEVIIKQRNHVMADRAQILLDERQSEQLFIAVGALHLPGEEGVVRLLEQKGFTLTRVR